MVKIVETIRIYEKKSLGGWVYFGNSCGQYIYLRLTDLFNGQIVEIPLADGSFANLRLIRSQFQIDVIQSGLKSALKLESISIRPIFLRELLSAFSTKVIKRLVSGNLLKSVKSFSGNFLFGKGNIGFGSAEVAKIGKIGPLTSSFLDKIRGAEANEIFNSRDPSRFPKILVKFHGKKTDANQFGIGANELIFNDAEDYDYILHIGDKNRFWENSIPAIATLINEYDFSIMLFNNIENGEPNCFVANDKALYDNCGYPMPYLQNIKAKKEDIIVAPIIIGENNDFEYKPSPPSPIKDKKISIIIPTRDKAELLRKCIDSINKNRVENIEIIVVDNGSIETETIALFAELKHAGVRILPLDIEFNFSKLCNYGAANSNGDILVFLNNDVIIQSAEWLDYLVENCSKPEIGAIGAKLIFSDHSVQHCGIFFGLSEFCAHWAYKNESDSAPFNLMNYSGVRDAVTGALLCVEKAKFNEVGGFDECKFAITLNDVDLCLKLNERGYQAYYCAEIAALHLENATRKSDASLSQIQRRNRELCDFGKKWANYQPIIQLPNYYSKQKLDASLL